MTNRTYKIIDITLFVMWFIMMTIKVLIYEKSSPMDPYCVALLILVIIDVLIVVIKKVYSNTLDDILLWILRILLISAPIIITTLS
jgi:hypothetical protein